MAVEAMLIWLAWGVFVVWAGRWINQQWRLYRANDPYFQDPPEFSSFLLIELILVSNGVLHMLLDRKTLYPQFPAGFLHTGYSEAQLFFTLAWVILCAAVIRIYWKTTRHVPGARWHIGCWLLILGLVATSFFGKLVLDIPISRDTPFL